MSYNHSTIYNYDVGDIMPVLRGGEKLIVPGFKLHMKDPVDSNVTNLKRDGTLIEPTIAPRESIKLKNLTPQPPSAPQL